MQLEQLKVIVTGGAQGMGRTFVEEFIKGGARVTAADMNEAGLEALRKDLGEAGERLHTVKVNVADEASVEAMVRSAAQAHGGLNGLVNNAGIFRDNLLLKTDKATGEPVGGMSLEEWNAVIAVDLTGPFLCTRAFAREVVRSRTRSAVIVNISSISRHGNMGQSNYSAAKAGLVADTAVWGRELARYGVRVGAVAPGFVDTPILEAMRPEILEGLVSKVPLRRLARPAEIFQAVRFIVECDYFTGGCIDVDGGFHF